MSDDRPEFSVVAFYDDGLHQYIKRWMDAEEAVKMAAGLVEMVLDVKQTGGVNRIIITDGGDHTVFEWTRDKGVTFPTREMRDAVKGSR